METTTRPARPSQPDGSRRAVDGVTVVPPKRKVRIPELAVGLLVTVACALGAVLWHLNAVAKVPALATSVAVERGQAISADDLQVVYVASDDPFARLDDSRTADVIGRVAVADLAAGTLLTPSLVTEAVTVTNGEGVVGLALDPGQYPARGLVPGDLVTVVRSADEAGGDVDDAVVARRARVFAVEELASDRHLVSVIARESDAEAVAAAAGRGTLRLVLVAP